MRLNLPDGATAYTLSGLPIESVDVFVTEVKEIRPEVIDASEFDEASEETVNEEAQVSNEEINDAKE